MIKNIVHYGDIIAVPFFLLLVYYFYKIKNKTKYEYVLFIFVIGGFLADSIFSYNYLSNKL
jgi:hypothetical protein